MMNRQQAFNVLAERFRTAFGERPQAAIFLVISYAIWGSVSVRWITEFIEQAHPLTGLVTVLLLLYGLLLGFEPFFGRGSVAGAHIYLLLQLTLTGIALLLFYELDFFALLLLPLSGQAVYRLPQRQASYWIAIFMLINVLGQLYNFGWPGSISFILLYTGALFFVAAFMRMVLQAEAARRRSEGLLVELQAAHRQLQELTRQSEALAVAEERNRLARELHDSIAQTLYGLTLQSAAAARQLAAGELDQVERYLHTFQEDIQQTLRETRLMIFELRPVALEKGDLAAALRARLEAVEGRSGLAYRLESDEVGSLPDVVETGLYRIALEALNNTLKHGHAERIMVMLRRQVDRLCLSIADDGCGFDLQAAGHSGYGLRSMRERAAQLGGTFAITSEKGQGTTVTVEIPL